MSGSAARATGQWTAGEERILDAYFNLDRERTLRSYSRLLPLRRFERLAWRTRDQAMDTIAEALDRAPHTPVLTGEQVARLEPVDERTYRAQLLGSNDAGLYRPGGVKG